MVSIVDSQKKKFDSLLWVLVIALVALGIAAYYYFADQSLLLRVLGLIIVGVFATAIAFKTALGQQTWKLCLESVTEVRKMYWPTRQETVQTTFAVLAMVVVMGIILWSADFVLLRIVAWLTGLGGE